MENIPELMPLQETTQKKELMLMKRMKAKEKVSVPPEIKIQTKQDVRKERNRYAAQKSRDRKKGYLQHLENQNMRLKDIISRCEICSAQCELYQETYQNHSIERQSKDEVIPITQSPPLFVLEPQIFMREDNLNQESSSNLSKYFWFACLVVLVCMANFQSKVSDEGRVLQQTGLPGTNSAVMNYMEQDKMMKSVLRQSMNGKASALMNKEEINYCQKCIECLRNITNHTNGELSLLGGVSNETANSTAAQRILFCKSKAKFFLKIYEALMNPSEKQQKSSRQITRMLVKGKALNDLLQEDCFSGQLLNEEQEYIISFSLAILEMTPVKMSRSSKLSLHRD